MAKNNATGLYYYAVVEASGGYYMLWLRNAPQFVCPLVLGGTGDAGHEVGGVGLVAVGEAVAVVGDALEAAIVDRLSVP